MATTFVRVDGPPDRDVFVNGQFDEPAGFTGKPFRVEIGLNTFTLLTPARDIEAETTVDVPRATRTDPFVVQLLVGVLEMAAGKPPARRPAPLPRAKAKAGKTKPKAPKPKTKAKRHTARR